MARPANYQRSPMAYKPKTPGVKTVLQSLYRTWKYANREDKDELVEVPVFFGKASPTSSQYSVVVCGLNDELFSDDHSNSITLPVFDVNSDAKTLEEDTVAFRTLLAPGSSLLLETTPPRIMYMVMASAEDELAYTILRKVLTFDKPLSSYPPSIDVRCIARDRILGPAELGWMSTKATKEDNTDSAIIRSLIETCFKETADQACIMTDNVALAMLLFFSLENIDPKRRFSITATANTGNDMRVDDLVAAYLSSKTKPTASAKK